MLLVMVKQSSGLAFASLVSPPPGSAMLGVTRAEAVGWLQASWRKRLMSNHDEVLLLSSNPFVSVCSTFKAARASRLPPSSWLPHPVAPGCLFGIF